MKSRSQTCSKEISINNFKLTHKNNLEFYQSQWQIGNSTTLLYVIYRIVLALFFSVTLVIAVIDLDNINKSALLRAKWMIYLTNWHFSVATLQSIIAAYMVTSMYFFVRKHGVRKQSGGTNRTLCGVYWALYTIAINGSLFVSLVYWTLVYDEKVDPLSVVNIFTHAVNAVLLLIDCFIVAHSIRLLHFYLPVAFNMIYVVFTIIYFKLGGTSKHGQTYIYSILNWDKPFSTIRNITLVCLFAMVLHILVCFYVQLRKRLAKFLAKHETTNNALTPLSPLMIPSRDDSPDSEKEDTNHNQV